MDRETEIATTLTISFKDKDRVPEQIRWVRQRDLELLRKLVEAYNSSGKKQVRAAVKYAAWNYTPEQLAEVGLNLSDICNVPTRLVPFTMPSYTIRRDQVAQLSYLSLDETHPLDYWEFSAAEGGRGTRVGTPR